MRNKRSRNHRFWKRTAAETDASFIDPAEAISFSKPRPLLSTITAREDAESNARWARAQLSAKLRGPVSLGEIVSLGFGAAAFSAFVNYKQLGQDKIDHLTLDGDSQEPENFAAQRAAMPVQEHAAKDFTWTNPTTEAGIKSDEGLQIARGSSFVPAILLRPLDDDGASVPYISLDDVTSPANRNWDVSALGKAGLPFDAWAIQADVNWMLNSVDIVIAAAEVVPLDKIGATPTQARTKLPDNTAPEAKTSQEGASEVMRTATPTDPNPLEAKPANRPLDSPADQVTPGPVAMKTEVDSAGRQPASASSQTADAGASKEPRGSAQEIGGSESGSKETDAQPKVWSSAAVGPTPAARGPDAAATTKGTIDQTEAKKAVFELKTSNKQSDDASEVAVSDETKFLAAPNLPNRDADAPQVVPEVDKTINPTVKSTVSGSDVRAVPDAKDEAVTSSAVPEKPVFATKFVGDPGNVTNPMKILDSITEATKAGNGPNAGALGQAGTLIDAGVATPSGKLHASIDHTKALDSVEKVEGVTNQAELSNAIRTELKTNHVMHDITTMLDEVIDGTTAAKEDNQRQSDNHLGYTKPLNAQLVAGSDANNKAEALLPTSDDAPFLKKTNALEKASVDQPNSPLDHSGASRIISQAETSDAAPVQPKSSQAQSSGSIAQVGMGAGMRAAITPAQNKLDGIVKVAKATDSADTEVSVGTEHAAASHANMGTSGASSSKKPSQVGVPDSLGVSLAQEIARKDQDDATTPPGPGETQLFHSATKVLKPTIQADRFEFASREIMSSLNDADHAAEALATFPTLHQGTTIPDWSANSTLSIVDDRSIETLLGSDHRGVSDADLVIF